MTVVTTSGEVRRRSSGRIGLVPTMGYFHEGHLSLIEAARAGSDVLVVSIFVNPTQFDDPADLDRYPRDVERDVELATAAGADLVFVPPVEEIYPAGDATTVRMRRVTDHMEGRFRPGHFDGVATVVARLFARIGPDRAWFGRKDAQQLAVIRRMVADMGFPIEVCGAPTIREEDGLALSSRNVFLASEMRRSALTISAGLFAACDALERGETSAARLTAIVRDSLEGVEADYVELAGRDDAQPRERVDVPSFLAVAGRVGGVRLIDNVGFDPAGDGWVADRGIRLTGPSLLYGGGSR